MLEIRNITKRFKSVYACRDVSFSVKKGEFFILLGPSGCGKSTILRTIAGLEAPDRGSVFLDGKDITGLSPQERDTAMVFQNYALYPNMTVWKNLEFPLKMKKTPRKEINVTVKETADLLRISHLLGKKAVKLSGGQQQRVAVGRALVRKPKIFLLDEPLSNLDAKLRQHLRVELARMHRELGVTMIYVTHDQSEAMTLGDRIAVMREGRVLQIGSPESVYSKPSDLFTAKFIGFPEINIFDVPVNGGNLKILGKTVPFKGVAAPEGRVLAAVRPEDIRLSGYARGMKAEIELREVSGPDTVLYVKAGGSRLSVRASKSESYAIDPRAEVFVDFDPSKLLFFNPVSGKLLK